MCSPARLNVDLWRPFFFEKFFEKMQSQQAEEFVIGFKFEANCAEKRGPCLHMADHLKSLGLTQTSENKGAILTQTLKFEHILRFVYSSQDAQRAYGSPV